MKALLTPPPWDVAPNYPNGMTSICCHDGSGWREIGIAKTASDARLMAAAPEMLAALIVADEALEEEGYEADGQYRKTIRSAISKALGTITQLEEGSIKIDVLVESRSGFGIPKRIVKVTDIATGISVEESDDKSLHRNVVVAKEKLAEKLVALLIAKDKE